MAKQKIEPWKSLLMQKRVGRNGKRITIIKLRTMKMGTPIMHIPQAFSSVNTHKDRRLQNPAVIPSKRWLRRFWIDELPQVVSVIKGDLRLFGTRAMMPKCFKNLPEWRQELYLKHGPSLIPLEAAIGKAIKTEADARAAYEKYFSEKEKKPKWTDFRYFVMFMRNALTGKIRGA